MAYYELKLLKENKIEVGNIVEIKDVDSLLESIGFDGLGLDFEIENNAMTFYKGDIIIEIIYEIIERKGYFGTVKIKSINKF